MKTAKTSRVIIVDRRNPVDVVWRAGGETTAMWSRGPARLKHIRVVRAAATAVCTSYKQIGVSDKRLYSDVLDSDQRRLVRRPDKLANSASGPL